MTRNQPAGRTRLESWANRMGYGSASLKPRGGRRGRESPSRIFIQRFGSYSDKGPVVISDQVPPRRSRKSGLHSKKQMLVAERQHSEGKLQLKALCRAHSQRS